MIKKNYLKFSAILCLGIFVLKASVFGQSVIGERKNNYNNLGGYIIKALRKHPSVQSAQAQIEAIRHGVQGARWQFWPTPSISAERVDTRDRTYTGDDNVIYLRLQQPLWTGGRLSGGLARAEAQAVEVEADFQEVQQRLALQVIQAWTEACVAQEKLDAYQISLSTHKRLLSLVQRRAAVGASSESDVGLALSRLEGVQAEIASVSAQRDTALARLNLLTFEQITPDQLNGTNEFASPVQVLDLEALVQAAHERSPQIAKLRAQSELAEAEIQLAKSTLSPEVYVRAERQMGNYVYTNMPSQNRVFFGMTSSFGSGLSSLSAVDAAIARYKAAVEGLQAQKLAIDDQIYSDVTLIRNAQKRQQSLQRALKSAEEVSISWERQFLAGRKQWQELLNAAREQLQTGAQLADAQGAIQQSGWRLKVLTQGVQKLLDEAANNISVKTSGYN